MNIEGAFLKVDIAKIVFTPNDQHFFFPLEYSGMEKGPVKKDF